MKYSDKYKWLECVKKKCGSLTLGSPQSLNESPMAAWLAKATSHTAELTVGSHKDVDWKCVGCGKIYSRKICYQTNGLCGRHCAQRNRQESGVPFRVVGNGPGQ